MKGSERDLGPGSRQIFCGAPSKTILHLSCRSRGKGQHQNLRGRNPSDKEQKENPLHEHKGLSASRPCDDLAGPAEVADCLLLGGVPLYAVGEFVHESLAMAVRMRESDSSLPRISMICVAPAGVTAFPETAMRSAQMTVLFFSSFSDA